MVAIKPQIIIQARMGSSRLPNKVMMPIKGKPLLGYQLERLKKTGLPVIISTSVDPKNQVIIDYAEELGIKTYRGSETNVLERYVETARFYNIKDIIRITGDNPLMDPIFINDQLEIFKEKPQNRRYYLSEGKKRKLPLGTSFEMFSVELLKEAYKKAKTSAEREHVTPFMHQNIPGDIDKFIFETNVNSPDVRLTVDTNADFDLIEKLIISHNCHQKDLDEIIMTFDENPNLSFVNNTIVQKKWDE